MIDRSLQAFPLSCDISGNRSPADLFGVIVKKRFLVPTLFGLIAMAGLSIAKDGTENFDSTAVGKLPTDWIAGDTGFGSPKWAVSEDPSALSKPNILLQFGSGRYPGAVSKRIRMTDGVVETRFKAISDSVMTVTAVITR